MGAEGNTDDSEPQLRIEALDVSFGVTDDASA
jgi:hypothetical protein